MSLVGRKTCVPSEERDYLAVPKPTPSLEFLRSSRRPPLGKTAKGDEELFGSLNYG